MSLRMLKKRFKYNQIRATDIYITAINTLNGKIPAIEK